MVREKERKREEGKRKRETERERERERERNGSIPLFHSSTNCLEKNSSSHVVGELANRPIKHLTKEVETSLILPTRQSSCI